MACEEFLCSLPGPGDKEIWINNMRTLARVVSAACDKNCNVFAARGGKKVTHHCNNALCKVVKVSGQLNV